MLNHLGHVYLIGAGPGDPDLLTVKALRLLQSANIVLHDSLVSPEILALIPAAAQCIDVGKRAGYRLLTQSDINSLLADAASHHQIVVRLKGGDPLLFGRAAEEIEALRAHNISFEIVPGISAAFASAAAAQVSLTDRRAASRVLFTTFSRSEDARTYSGVPIAPDTTVVVYMPGPDYSEVSRWLIDSGLGPETPCQVISKASQPDQSTHITTISALGDLTPLPAPALLIVGRIVAHSCPLPRAQTSGSTTSHYRKSQRRLDLLTPSGRTLHSSSDAAPVAQGESVACRPFSGGSPAAFSSIGFSLCLGYSRIPTLPFSAAAPEVRVFAVADL